MRVRYFIEAVVPGVEDEFLARAIAEKYLFPQVIHDRQEVADENLLKDVQFPPNTEKLSISVYLKGIGKIFLCLTR